MKTLKHTLLIGLMTLLLSPLSFAQNFDANRMNRDIKIMENILDELFKLQTTNTKADRNANFAYLSGSSRNTVGTYIPGYGLIFKVPHFFSSHVSSIEINKDDAGERKVTFFYKSDNPTDSEGLNTESVKERITEFLKDYASTITQIKPDEYVMVLYGAESPSGQSPFFEVRLFSSTEDSKINEKDSLPVISVSVKKSDLDAFRGGSINDSAFKNRISSSAIKQKEQLDLKVMSNILETAFGESENEMFKISGKPAYLALDNFGVLFTMNVKHNRTSAMGSIVFHDEEVRKVIRASGIQQLDVLSPEEAEEKRAEQAEQAKASFEQLKTNVTDYLIDYGRTLNSISSDQHILLTINILSNRWDDEIPSRLDIQLKKSVLERLERGVINRNEAINAVTITEY